MGQRLAGLESKLQTWLERANQSNRLPALTVLLAFISTLTAAYPATAVIVTAVLLSPHRWLRLSLACAAGSAAGGGVIITLAHLLGYNEIHAWFPDLISAENWNLATRWFADYGTWALFGVGASPLPQMPLLILFGFIDDRLFVGFLALLGGKVLKYVVIAWVTQHFPERLAFFRRAKAQITDQA